MAFDNGPVHAGAIQMNGNPQGTPKFVPGTVTPAAGSSLVDKALPSQSVWDVNYKPRPKDGNGDGVAKGDIGAVERQTP